MAEYEDTSTALHRLEAALNRIAVHVAKPRPLPASEGVPDAGMLTEPAAGEAAPEDTTSQDKTSQDAASGEAGLGEPARHEIVTKLDDLIGGLRSALGIERHS